MYNSFPELTSKYRMGVSRVLSLLNSDIFDITPTLYISVSMCRIAHLVPGKRKCIHGSYSFNVPGGGTGTGAEDVIILLFLLSLLKSVLVHSISDS